MCLPIRRGDHCETTYNVYLGSDEHPPQCSCPDWRKNLLPCKHMCGILRLMAGVTWESLGSKNTDSPLFNLDSICVPTSKCPAFELGTQIDLDTTVDCTVSGDESDEVVARPRKCEMNYVELKKRQLGKRSTLRNKCTASLKDLIDATHALKDEQYLEQLNGQLADLLQATKAHLTTDDGIVLIKSPTKEERTFLKRKAEDDLGNLPKKPTRSKYSKRYGERADVMKTSFKVPYDISSTSSSPTLPASTSSTSQRLPALKPKRFGKRRPAQNILPNCSPWVTVERINLTLRAKETIESGDWLDDRILLSAQEMLKANQPLMMGLEDPAMLRNMIINVPVSSEAIQMHHIGDHWVVSTSVGGEVVVYDSMSARLSPHLREQLGALYKFYAKGEDGLINVEVRCVQQQYGGADCGLFAIAQATSIANGIDPRKVKYDQTKMRGHLVTCLESNDLTPFPHANTLRPVMVVAQHHQITKYCKCKKYIPSSEMVECDVCKQWYHYKCVGFPNDISGDTARFMIVHNMYKCSKCIQ